MTHLLLFMSGWNETLNYTKVYMIKTLITWGLCPESVASILTATTQHTAEAERGFLENFLN